MKTKYLLIVFSLFILSANAQDGIFLYPGDSSSSTDSSVREFVKVRPLTDGSMIHAGQADEGSDADFSLCKISPSGEIVWQKKFGTPGLDVLKNFIITEDGGFVLVGWTIIGSNTYSDALIVRLNSNAEIQWVRTFGGLDDDEAFGATELSDGNIMITGTTYSFGPKLRNAFAVKLDISSGDMIWSKAFAKGTYNYFIDAIALPDGGAIACGYTWVTSGGAVFDPMFVRLDSLGNPVWSKWLKTAGSQIIYDFEKDIDGGIVFGGVSTVSGAPNQNYISKINPEGIHQWSRVFGTPNGDRIWDLTVLPDGRYLAAGFSGKNSSDASPRNGFVARLNSQGLLEEALLVGTEDTLTTTFTGIAIAGNSMVANGFSYKNNPRGAGIAFKIPNTNFAQACGASLIPMPGSALTVVDSAGILFQEGGASDEPSASIGNNNLLPQTICLLTGIELPSSSGIQFWPNPGNGIYRLDRIPSEQILQAAVYSAHGKECWKGNVNGGILDLRFLPDGLYQLTLYGSGFRKALLFSQLAE